MTGFKQWVGLASAVVGLGVVGTAATATARPSPCTEVAGVATWSPDGRQIAFVGGGGRATAVCVADAEGRRAQPLRGTTCPRRGYCRLIDTPEDLHWPRPKRLVYGDAAKGIFVVPLAGKPKRIGASTDSYGKLSIDARGDRVAYGSPGCPTCDVPVTVISVPKGMVIGRIGGPKTDNAWPSLSPDGKRVVFVHGTATTFGIRVAAVHGGRLHPLEQCGGEPLWSAKGDKVACPGTGSMSSGLLLVSVRTGDATTLLRAVGPSDGVRNGHILGWSPNGQRIALLYGRCGCRLDVLDTATDKLRQLLGGAAATTDVSWSPDSRTLLVVEPSRAAPDCSLLWRLRAAGGKRQLLRDC